MSNMDSGLQLFLSLVLFYLNLIPLYTPSIPFLSSHATGALYSCLDVLLLCLRLFPLFLISLIFVAFVCCWLFFICFARKANLVDV